MKFTSLRFKISVLFTSILFILLVIFSGVLIVSVKSILYKDLNRSLKAKAIQIEAILDAYNKIRSSESDPAVIFQSLIGGMDISAANMEILNRLWYADVKALNIQYDYFRLVNGAGTSILFSENFPEQLIPVFDGTVPLKTSTENIFVNVSFGGKRYRLINYPFEYGEKKQFLLQVATPVSRADFILLKFSQAVLFTVFFITLFTALFGSFFSDRILRPIMDVISAADSITHRDMSVRIHDTSRYDELKTLVSSFNIMIERLETSFRHINEFSSHVAHELKTPLAIMKGELELALSDKSLNDKDRRLAETMMEEVDRLVVIIKDMLLMAKLDYDISIYKFELLDLNKFFTGLYEQSLVLTDVKGICLDLNMPEDPGSIHADGTHLKRLFLNLINNAVKYTPPEGRISINVKKTENKITVGISDTGDGISEDNINKIFDKFFRLKKDDSDTSVGLGLNIALSIARAHHGDITVQSTVGKGSTFTVYLPISHTGA